MSSSLDKLESLTDNLFHAERNDRNYIKALELVLKMSNLGFWVWNIETDYLFLTWHWLDQLGYKEGDVKPHVNSWMNLCHPDDLKKAQDLLLDHFASRGKIPYDLIIRYKSREGKQIPLRSYGEVFIWDKEKPIMMGGLVEPI